VFTKEKHEKTKVSMPPSLSSTWHRCINISAMGNPALLVIAGTEGLPPQKPLWGLILRYSVKVLGKVENQIQRKPMQKQGQAKPFSLSSWGPHGAI